MEITFSDGYVAEQAPVDAYPAIADLLNRSLGIQDFWSFEELISPEECFERLTALRKSSKSDGDPGKIDEIFITVIVDFLRTHSAHTARASFLQDLITLVHAPNGPFDINVVITTLLSKLSLAEFKLWSFFVKLIKKGVSRANTATHIEILRRIIECIQAMPADISFEQFRSVNKGIKLLEILSPAYLPSYTVMAEIVLSGSQAVHWALSSYFADLLLIKSNLSTLYTVLDFDELCRIIGPSREDEYVLRRKIVRKHQIPIEDTQRPPTGSSSLWNRNVNTLLHMIYEGVPLYLIKSQVTPFHDVDNGNPVPSDCLLTASVLRIMQLINSAESKADGAGSWWDEWQHFADQFYSFVEFGLLDYEQFVFTLSRSRTTKGERVKDNAIVWLLTQCLPLDPVKQLFKEDLLEKKNGPHFGFLIPMILGFYNKQQATDTKLYHDLRDTAVTCLLFRMYNIIGADAPSEVRRYLNSISEKVQTLKVLTSYRMWYTDSQKNGELIDYYSLPAKMGSVICVLSSFMSQPIASSVFEFLQKPETDPTFASALGGELIFRGKVKPLSTSLLAHFSIRCRQRVLEHIEATLFDEKQSALDVKPPGLIDTYARLLYIAPGSRNKYRLQNNLRSSEPVRLHTLLEIINYRLLRYFRYHNAVKELFLDLFEYVAKANTNAQLWKSIENLLIKICESLPQILKFSQKTDTIDFGETLNRCLVLYTARTLKIYGMHDYSQINEIPALLTRLHSLSPHIWSANTLRYFPPVIRNFFMNKSHPPQVVTRDKVVNEFKMYQQHFEYLDRSCDLFIKRYKQDASDAPLFLCVMWLVTLEHHRTDGLLSACKIIQSFTPKDQTLFTYLFVDFLLDESPLQPRAMSTELRTNYTPEIAPPQKIAEAAALLSSFAWNYHLLDFETLILALTDRDDDPNAMGLLEYLLVTDGQLSTRVEYFCSLNINKDHWKEENYWVKHRDFELKFEQPISLPRLPVYYSNVCLRSISVLNLVLYRLIESDRLPFAGVLIDLYHKILKYNEAPSEFVLHILLYYSDSEVLRQNYDFKMKLLQLIDVSSMGFSETFISYTKGHDPSLFNEHYFVSAVSKLAGIIATYPSLNLNNFGPPQSLFHLFQEFPTVTERTHYVLLLELLLSPLQPYEVGRYLIESFFQQKNKPFAFVNSLAALLSYLPPSASLYLQEKGLHILKHEKSLANTNLATMRPSLDTFINFACDYTSNAASYVHSDANKLLVLTQLFYNYSSAGHLEQFPHFFRLCRPVMSLEQLYFLCKIIAPFLYRIMTNGELLSEILLEAFYGLMDVQQSIGFLYAADFSPLLLDTTNSLVLLDITCDFLFHCKNAFPKLTPEFFGKVREIVRQFPPELRRKFAHF